MAAVGELVERPLGGLREAACVEASARLEDAIVAPVFGEYISGLVVDVSSASAPETSGGSRPMYALSDESAHYPGPLTPLRFSTPEPPRRIRVYGRAEEYCNEERGQTRNPDFTFWSIELQPTPWLLC